MKKKVLIIVENAPVPFDPRVWKEALSLSKNAYDVTVLCPRDKGYDQRHEVLNGIHIYRHPMPREGNGLFGYLREYACALFWQFLYAWWIYLRRGFDVIQGCNPPDDIFLVALPFKLLGVKYIFDHHDANPELYFSKYEKTGLLYQIQVWLERQTYRFSDVVMATNSSYRDLALIRGGIAPEDVFIVRNGPDLDTFKAVPPDHDLKYGKRYLIGYVGTMSIQEGLDILLDVALYIKNLGRHDIHFTCVGGGPGLAGLRKMVRAKSLDEMVNFTGRVSDEQLLLILSTADVCVNPDKPCRMNDISTMIKIMEYMALGKPIVQFDLREGRHSAQGASLYADNENQVADFAAKILWLLDNPDARERMGQVGLRRVEEELAWDYSVANLLSAYARALNKKAESGGRPRLEYPGEHRTLAQMSRPFATSIAPDRHNGAVPTASRTASLHGKARHLLTERYRCPESVDNLVVAENLSGGAGYFRFGSDITCYGQCSSGAPAGFVDDHLHDAAEHVSLSGSSVQLPFDPTQVLDNLRSERYHSSCFGAKTLPMNGLFRGIYYLARPMLAVSVRKHLQQRYFRGWEKIPFPKWPVDRTVEDIFEQLLFLSMVSQNLTRVPFIWYWPDGIRSCTMITHDVETSAGRDFCPRLMDLNDSFGIKSSFQVVPEKRYVVSQPFLESIRSRGFEINVQDLNHDGLLFSNREEFLRRATKINHYAREFAAAGFRAGVLYRNPDWFEALDFSYDMSIPNVAHLDPQRGGCCTVMPFFVGNILELPVTVTQDYTLFNIFNDYSIRLWKEQIALIREKYGLMNFIIHPDYIIDNKARSVYSELLHYLAELRSQSETWIALPREVDAWWRLRSNMNLVRVAGSWRIEGKGSERARLAYAVRDNGKLTYHVEPAPANVIA